MTDKKPDPSSSEALGRVEQVLSPGTEFQHQHCYIDTLGENPRPGIRRDQSLFRTRLLASIYERFWRPKIFRLFFGKGLEEEDERRIVLDMLNISPGESVLDVGCGTGNYTRHLAAAAGDGLTVGMDAAKPMIAAAARRGGNANLAYVRGDACALPFSDGEFDAICSVGVVHMLAEPMMAVAEMARVLAPGGRLVIVASCEENAIPIGRNRFTTFGREELTSAFISEGLLDVEQHVVWRAQFVAGRKPAEVKVEHGSGNR